MQCPQCNSPMRKTDEIIERHTRQTWYGCEHCGAEHTVSERGGAQAAQRIGNAYRFSAMPMFPTPGRGSA